MTEMITGGGSHVPVPEAGTSPLGRIYTPAGEIYRGGVSQGAEATMTDAKLRELVEATGDPRARAVLAARGKLPEAAIPYKRMPLPPGSSGESEASAEAISRTTSEKAKGVKYFIERPGGTRTPVSSIDVHGGMRLNPGSRIIRVGPEGESTVR